MYIFYNADSNFMVIEDNRNNNDREMKTPKSYPYDCGWRNTGIVFRCNKSIKMSTTYQVNTHHQLTAMLCEDRFFCSDS